MSDLPYLKKQIFRQRSAEMRQVVSKEPMPNTKPWMPYQRHPVSPNTQAWHKLTEGERRALVPPAYWIITFCLRQMAAGLNVYCCLWVDNKVFCTWKWWKMAFPRGWSQNRRVPGWWSWAPEVWASFSSYSRLTTPCHSPALMWHLEKE